MYTHSGHVMLIVVICLIAIQIVAGIIKPSWQKTLLRTGFMTFVISMILVSHHIVMYSQQADVRHDYIVSGQDILALNHTILPDEWEINKFQAFQLPSENKTIIPLAMHVVSFHDPLHPSKKRFPDGIMSFSDGGFTADARIWYLPRKNHCMKSHTCQPRIAYIHIDSIQYEAMRNAIKLNIEQDWYSDLVYSPRI